MLQRDRRVLYALIGLVILLLLALNILRPAGARPISGVRTFALLVGIALVVWALSRRR